jgi:putative two-component system response regulator
MFDTLEAGSAAALVTARRSARRSPEALTLVAFQLCAAAVLLVAVLFPMSDQAPIGLGYVMIGVALAMAAGTFAFADRLPRGVLLGEAVAIVALNSLLVANAHTPGGAIGDTIACGWLVVWVAVFFPGAAGVFAAMVAAGFGIGLLASGLPDMVAPWALVTLTTATVGAVMARVSRLVRRHVETDALTGALNRGGLHAAAGRAATRTRRRAAPITVAVLDLDAFKAVNDRDGHAEGDRLLAEASAAWRGALRGDDLLGRVGGDEFVVIMPGTSPDEAAGVLDRLRARHPVEWSAGVAEWRPGESLEACLERADERLYAAKRAPRDAPNGQGPGADAGTRATARPAASTPAGGSVESASRPAQRRAGAGALLGAVTALVPRGRALSESDWRSRHRAALWTAVGVSLLGSLYGIARGVSAAHLAGHLVAVLPLLATGFAGRATRLVRSAAVSLALMVAAALVVHAANGATEAHFLFFVLVPIAALYADWRPLGLAVGFLFAHHLLLGVVAGEHVFEVGTTPAWEQAAVHAGLVLAACAASLIEWRMTETRLLGLRAEVLDRSADLRTARSDVDAAHAETVRRLSMAVEFRDKDTGEHTDRIGRHSRMLAGAAGMAAGFAERIGYAAPLHDVGKVAVPDAVLLKPGPLTPQERAVIETHAEQGYRLLRGSSSKVLEMAASIAWTHHERWDGTGYPRRLAGEDIPVEGRIVAIADVYDALTADRVYRRAMPIERALAVMREGRGSQFDPGLLDLFLERVEHGWDAGGPSGRVGTAGER